MAKLRKLGRRTDHRTAMLRNLVTSLFKGGRIKTTVTRAKESQKIADKCITLAKKNQLASNRALSSYIYDNEVAKKLVTEIAPLYKDRKGGYTRIIKMGPRRGDGAQLCILELVEMPAAKEENKED